MENRIYTMFVVLAVSTGSFAFAWAGSGRVPQAVALFRAHRWTEAATAFAVCGEIRDRLEEFPKAIEAVYPRTEVQLCIVHLVRAR